MSDEIIFVLMVFVVSFIKFFVTAVTLGFSDYKYRYTTRVTDIIVNIFRAVVVVWGFLILFF